jgi:signal transduction histidine kinase
MAAAQKQETPTDPPGPPVAGAEDGEAMLRSTLDALSAHIAVLDETGAIIAVNQAWREFAAAGAYAGPDHGIGVNYLAVCEASADASDEAARAAGALRDIMAGRREAFRMEYPCQTPDGPRWFQLRVTRPCTGQARRIVVAHEDITEVKRAEESLARLNARLLRLQDEERRRIARELHDTTAQNLLAIALSATRLQDRRREPVHAAAGAVGEILDLAERSLQEVRTLCYLLHPPLLDDVGLEAALRWLARGFGERSGIAAETRIEEVRTTLSQDAATALFRVAQEALLNVHRHSGSAWARVSLRHRQDEIELSIEDSGRGMASLNEPAGWAEIELGVGVSGMRARLEQLGGRLELRARRPGLLVRAVLPLSAERDGPQNGSDTGAAS